MGVTIDKQRVIFKRGADGLVFCVWHPKDGCRHFNLSSVHVAALVGFWTAAEQSLSDP